MTDTSIPSTADASRTSGLLASPAAKIVVIGIVVMLLMVPLFFVHFLVEDRAARARMVTSEIGETWARGQVVAGPVLVVPASTEGDGARRRHVVIMPERLDVSTAMATESRRRGVFDATVYKAKIAVTGRFGAPPATGNTTTLYWDEAVVSMLISDMRGIETAVSLEAAGGKMIPFEKGAIPGATRGETGIHAPLRGLRAAADAGAPAPGGTAPLADGFEFRVVLELAGSSVLAVAPLGRDTSIKMESDWRHPSFQGPFLPDERRIEEGGFTAAWRIPYLARSNPPFFFTDTDAGLACLVAGAVGVELYRPVELYQLVSRAVKYAVLFIAPAFLVVFVVELVARARLHPIQYALMGLALVLFYVLLLSFAERIGFDRAYSGAAAATTALIGAYVGTGLRRLRYGLATSMALAILYGVLYLVLRSEDDALMAGSVGGFVALTVAMFATRRIDWSGRASIGAQGA